VALADVFDALSSKRTYKEAWDEHVILSRIEESAGTHFDPELVEIFLNRFDIMRAIRKRYQEERDTPDAALLNEIYGKTD
jgi:response regulator RpfG family c-di-GMP phosphodiesterase